MTNLQQTVNQAIPIYFNEEDFNEFIGSVQISVSGLFFKLFSGYQSHSEPEFTEA
jgi:hypothetical protein